MAIEQTKILLETATHVLAGEPAFASAIDAIKQLQEKIDSPCVLAIAGKVKAGKSSFLNALLGKPLAKVGDLETTATINRFVYGRPHDMNRPVRVHWEDGHDTYETLDFMDSLQGRNAETLKKSAKIEFLEFQLEDERLRHITLVDTPGTDAVVDEHQKVVDEFFSLREKHKKQTLFCTSQADAVIYLVGAVAGVNAQRFLIDFQEASPNASPINAIGVLAKVDIDEQLLANRKEQSEYVAQSLRDQLYSVVPISAGLYDALNKNSSRLPTLYNKIKNVPEIVLNYLLRQETIFLTDKIDVLNALYSKAGVDNSPLSVMERKELLGDLPWSIFRTIVQTFYNAQDFQSGMHELYGYANIDEVKALIKEQFFDRSKLIRCYSVLDSLRKIIFSVQNNTIEQLRLQNPSKPIETFLVLDQRIKDEIINPLETMLVKLRETDLCYKMTHELNQTRQYWSEEDYAELARLTKLHDGVIILTQENLLNRIMYWQIKCNTIRYDRMKQLAEFALQKLNGLYEEN